MFWNYFDNFLLFKYKLDNQILFMKMLKGSNYLVIYTTNKKLIIYEIIIKKNDGNRHYIASV